MLKVRIILIIRANGDSYDIALAISEDMIYVRRTILIFLISQSTRALKRAYCQLCLSPLLKKRTPPRLAQPGSYGFAYGYWSSGSVARNMRSSSLLKHPSLLNKEFGNRGEACADASTDSAATPARSSLFISSLPAVEADKAVH